MITVTLKYGLSKVLQNIEVDETSTAADLADEFGSVLGLPESYTILINGSVVSGDTRVRDGSVVVFEKTACSKA